MKYSIDQSLLGLKEDFEILVDQMPQRKKWYKNLRNRSDLKELGMGSNAFQDSALDQLVTDLNKTSSRLNEELASHWDQLNNWNEVLPTTPLENARGVLANLLNDLSGVVLELSLARASVRLESIVMIEVSVDPKIAHQTASEARLDWMNARAALVDSWRMTDLARDDLRTDLDLVLSGDLGSDSMGSGHFKSSEGRVSVGIELDTPLSKVRERNRYQASLIQYQQARRQYLAFEDSVLRSLRQHTRLAKLYQLNFELSRAAVRGAIAQVDLARLRLNEPPQPGKNSQFGATTARDLVNALNDLLEASNSFLSVWIGYEAMRMRLTYDLGAMSLSDNGLWEDLGAIISMEPPL
jgi:outer membrane protein TolC